MRWEELPSLFNQVPHLVPTGEYHGLLRFSPEYPMKPPGKYSSSLASCFDLERQREREREREERVMPGEREACPEQGYEGEKRHGAARARDMLRERERERER